MGRDGRIDANSMAMGLPLGIIVGILMDNVAFGIPIGLVFGIALAASKARKSAGDDGGAPEDRGA
jgi:hypothetical protein